MFEVLLIILVIVIDLCSKSSVLRGKDKKTYRGRGWSHDKSYKNGKTFF